MNCSYRYRRVHQRGGATFPDSVRIVVPYPPGGSTDLDMKTEGEKWANVIKANNITVE